MTKRLLPRLAAAGVAGALALGGALIATAPASAATQGDRLEGPFVTKTSLDDAYKYANAWTVSGSDLKYKAVGEAMAPAAADVFTFPAVGTSGPVISPSGKCLQGASALAGKLSLANCDSSSAQTWSMRATGVLVDGRGWSFTDNQNTGLGASNPEVAFSTDALRLDILTLHVAVLPVDVTGPAAGETVTTDKPVISGSGQPGASITVKDKDGNILGTTTVDDKGAWSVTPSTPLPQGPNTVAVEQDANGTKSTDSVDFTVGKEAIAGVTATIDSVNVADKSAVISGTGQPGATIQITGPAGTIEVTVDDKGDWKATVPGLIEGTNDIQVKQVIDGDTHGEKTVTVTLTVPGIADVTAVATDIDNDAKTAVIEGTGQPGATITVTTPTGPVTTVVDADGKWSLTAPGLAEGENTIPVTQTVDGKDAGSTTVTVVIGILETPIADPYIAGGALLLAAGIGITTIAIRRRKTAAVAAA